MKFKVPKFLEREMRFFNLVTFKQLILLGGAGIVLFIIYYAAPKSIFFPALFIIGGGLFTFMFVRIQGVPLSQLAAQSLGFFTSPRKYIWRKKWLSSSPIKLLEKERLPEKKEEREVLRISPKSRLGKLSTRIEIGLR